MVPARAAEIIIVLVTFLWLIRRILVQSALQFWLKCYDLKAKITLLYFLSWKNALDIYFFLIRRINIHNMYRRNCYWNYIKNVVLTVKVKWLLHILRLLQGHSSNPSKLKRIKSERAFFILFQTVQAPIPKQTLNLLSMPREESLNCYTSFTTTIVASL